MFINTNLFWGQSGEIESEFGREYGQMWWSTEARFNQD